MKRVLLLPTILVNSLLEDVQPILTHYKVLCSRVKTEVSDGNFNYNKSCNVCRTPLSFLKHINTINCLPPRICY